jgi:hypothetical protein
VTPTSAKHVFTFPRSLTSSLTQTYKQYSISRITSSPNSYTTKYASATPKKLTSRCSLSDPTARCQHNRNQHASSGFASQHPGNKPRTHEYNHKHKCPDNPHHDLPNSTGSTAGHGNFHRHFYDLFNNRHSTRKTTPRVLPECSTRLAAHPRNLLVLMAGHGLGPDGRVVSGFIPGESRLVGSDNREMEGRRKEGTVCQQKGSYTKLGEIS